MTTRFLKRGLERMAIGLGVARRRRAAAPHTCAIVAYHNVVRNGSGSAGDASLHLPFATFREQIERLARTHEVVDHYSEPFQQRRGGPRAVITFDDGYRGAIRHALPFLAERGLPALVFICPGLLGEPGFWWDRAAGPDGLPPPLRRRAFSEFAGRNHAIVESMGPGTALGTDFAPASIDELRKAAYPGLTYASHAWSHPSLPHLSDAELREELRKPLEWASEHLPADLWSAHDLAFPYGHWDERVARIAAECGYTRLYRVEGGPAPAAAWSEPVAVLPRINVPRGLSPDGLELRMAGVLGR